MSGVPEVRGWTVRGRVQGVGFRFFVMREASDLGLRGTVRNLSDGSVEVVAGGSVEQLEELKSRLRAGPENSNVVEVTPVFFPESYVDLPSPFRIVS